MIIYFSGTGNSAFVARKLGELLGDDNIFPLERDNLKKQYVDVGSDTRIVWCFPVYSWGIPPVVSNFISQVKFTPDEDLLIHHIVFTCGDDIGLADMLCRRLFTRLGRATGNISSVIMPNIYTLMKGFDVDPVALEQKKISEAGPRIEKIAADIISGEDGTDVVSGKFPWFKSSIIYPWFVRFEMSPKPFFANDKCISCGKCAAGCALCNIEMSPSDNRPLWGKNCALCLRCYHFCPTNAVQYGKTTRNKGQYKQFADTKF